MSIEPRRLLEAGGAALGEGDWAGARDAFRAALELEETADALHGLGSALWWLGEMSEAVRHWESAYGHYRRQARLPHAVGIAVQLSLAYGANLGNRAAATGWAARAARVAGEVGDDATRGWALIARASTCEDLSETQALAREAQAVAVAAGDRDLELCALSALGAALVDAGRSDEGAPLMDEALAGALGGEGQLDTVVFASCLLMQSCYRCADFVRIIEWTRALEAFIERYGCPYVNATCRAHFGAVLVATGDWPRAEVELDVARRLAGEALPGVRAEVIAYLAELRLAQGRVEEARRLVAGFENHAVVVPVVAALSLAGGDTGVAAAIVQRHLAGGERRALDVARLRELLGETRLASGDADAALDEGRAMVERGAEVGSVLMQARGERLVARALAVRDGDAVPHLERALGYFGDLEMPLEAARTRMLLAAVLAAEHPDVAAAEAQAALAVFEDLGAVSDADGAAAWLRAVGVTPVRHSPKGISLLTKREHEVFGVLAEGLSNPEIAERLYVSRRTVEHHVASILSKLGLRNRAEIAAYAARHAAPAPPGVAPGNR